MSKHIIYGQKERTMIYDTFIYLALLLTKQFYHQELSWLVTLMIFPCTQEMRITPWLWFSIHVSVFVFSCPVAFPKPESEVSSSFQPHFPDSNLISIFFYLKSSIKKGHECIKIIKGQIEVLSDSKGVSGKEGPMSLFHLMRLLLAVWISRGEKDA